MPTRRGKGNVSTEQDLVIPPLYKQAPGIQKSKYDHLQELTATIPAFFHPFYAQLKVKSEKRITPEETESAQVKSNREKRSGRNVQNTSEETGKKVTGKKVVGNKVTGKKVTGKKVTGKKVTGKCKLTKNKK
jgi:hypothetical protein